MLYFKKNQHVRSPIIEVFRNSLITGESGLAYNVGNRRESCNCQKRYVFPNIYKKCTVDKVGLVQPRDNFLLEY